MPSSNESSSCRIDWRPSRWLLAAIAVLTGLAVVSIVLSAIPAWPALGLALVCVGHGVALVRREAFRPGVSVHLTSEPGLARLNLPHGVESWTQAQVSFRGPLASLSGRDGAGSKRRLLWWPDTLPAPARRRLHLVAGRLPAVISPMALPPGS
jgi:toxin CptA